MEESILKAFLLEQEAIDLLKENDFTSEEIEEIIYSGMTDMYVEELKEQANE